MSKNNQKYKPKYKPNQLILGSGNIVIVTGWTDKKYISKKLEENEYAAIGNLYSPTRGINFLIRNLFLNPHVRHLVILSATKEDKNSGGCECLYDFFRYGIFLGKNENGDEKWVIDSPIKGYIDIEIPYEKLEDLRVKFYVQYAENLDNLISFVKVNHEDLKTKEPGFFTKILPESESFPIKEVESSILPGARYGHRIEGKTIAETWIKILHRIKTTGAIRPTGYDGNVQELIDLVAVVNSEPEDFYFPEPNYLPIDRDYLNDYIPQILDDKEYVEGVKYSYGQRLRSWFGYDQIEQVINKLIGEIDAASGVMNLWDVKDHLTGGSPCLNHIWVRIVDNELSLTATFRSNDMFSAWVANAMGLRALQMHIKEEIEKRFEGGIQLKLAPLITVSQSAHIYDDCWENVDFLIKEHYKKMMKEKDYNDYVGNFIIETVSGVIMVTQTDTNNEPVKQYRGISPLKLINEISSSAPSIKPGHIGYLGIELQKALNAIQNNRNYVQDRV